MAHVECGGHAGDAGNDDAQIRIKEPQVENELVTGHENHLDGDHQCQQQGDEDHILEGEIDAGESIGCKRGEKQLGEGDADGVDDVVLVVGEKVEPAEQLLVVFKVREAGGEEHHGNLHCLTIGLEGRDDYPEEGYQGDEGEYGKYEEADADPPFLIQSFHRLPPQL
ncbi:hypothetical protein SDC9_87515 [bioreactor metagenome]|uniref:Uncharacterized protein n=1 Tax=bioreactor metagenome TaxID=1076179 RepID=A0A644ZJF7_9ZZZZ